MTQKIHPDPKKTVMRDGVRKAYPVFRQLVTKSERVKTGEKRRFITNASASNQKTVSSSIFQTDKRDPIYTDEDGIDKVGSVRIDLPGEGRDRELAYFITFGGTELEVEVRDLRPGGDSKTCTVDFLCY